MNILIIGLYKKTGAGGISGHIKNLALSLSKIRGSTVHIITFGNTNLTEKLGDSCVTVHVIKISNFFISIFKVIETINPDIIHFHGTFLPFSAIIPFLNKKYPLILTVHALVANEYKYHKGVSYLFKRFIEQRLEKYVLSDLKNVIVVSPVLQKSVEEMTNNVVNFIPNALNTDEIINLNLDNHFSLKTPSLLFVGSFGKIKGLDILINSISIIKKWHNNVHLYIAGTGSREGELQKLVKKLDLEHNVDFLGYITGSDKFNYYKNSDIFVLPSLSDSFPTSLLEAMIMKLPVVASNVGGIPFIIEDGKSGMLFESGNSKDLAEKIILLIENHDLRRKLGDCGFLKVQEFTWNYSARKIIDLYEYSVRTYKSEQ
jgi:glycosyltransferase involved in cell wall biosynthesis